MPACPQPCRAALNHSGTGCATGRGSRSARKVREGRLSARCCHSRTTALRALVRDRAAGACCCAHAREQSPGRSPSTTSPLDCLCPGSLPRAGSTRPSSLTSLRHSPTVHGLPLVWRSTSRERPQVSPERSWLWRCVERSKGGGSGISRPGGHERNATPQSASLPPQQRSAGRLRHQVHRQHPRHMQWLARTCQAVADLVAAAGAVGHDDGIGRCGAQGG